MPRFTSESATDMAQRSNAIRSRRALDKGHLKDGDATFTDVASSGRWNDKTVLELLGYALIGRYGSRGVRAGRQALSIARRHRVDHFTLVGDLSAREIAAIGDAVQAAVSEPRRSDGSPSDSLATSSRP